MNLIQVHFAPAETAYTGEQLRSHWAYNTFGLLGDSAVAFIGPCDVKPEFMKDVEDLKASSRIYSERMLHFIVEHFETDLDRAVLRQRLLIVLICEAINRRLHQNLVLDRSVVHLKQIKRRGSDLYDGDRKVTVSIASVSPVSSLIHAGVNISSRNTPVPTHGLDDFRIEPAEFAEEILGSYSAECDSAQRARCKVRPCE